jgi:N-acetylglucosaminyldiphosphoundecaprenol N-acetyl-beta-D-mannosaminyltransferase
VLLGAPKQELFAAHAVSKVDTVGFISIGAGLDFIAGTQTRAPKFIRLIAAEWLCRLLTNPQRLGMRYARCIAVMPQFCWCALKARLKSKSAPEVRSPAVKLLVFGEVNEEVARF